MSDRLPTTVRYDHIGTDYASTRRPDRRLSAAIGKALAGAATILDVGAGTGSYETGNVTCAVEPSVTMIAQRRPDAAPCVRAVAEALPFADGSFDASLAVLTVHHWDDWRRGIDEMRRVSSRQVVLAWDQDAFEDYWLLDYLPEIRELDRARAPDFAELTERLAAEVSVWEVPADCEDGFLCAWFARPEAYLDPRTHVGISVFRQLPAVIIERGLAELAADLEDGTWDSKYGGLRSSQSLDAGYRLLVGVTW